MIDQRPGGNVFAQFVKIKRKRFWVVRWVEISAEGVMMYKEKPADKVPRGSYIINEGTVQERIDSDGEMVILRMNSGDKESVKLMASTRQDHQQLVDKLKYYSKLPAKNPKQIVLTKQQNQGDLSLSSIIMVDQQDSVRQQRGSMTGPLNKYPRFQDESGNLVQRFQVDEELLKNSIGEGLLLKLKANCNLMIGQMSERNLIRIDTSKDLETFIQPKKHEKHRTDSHEGYPIILTDSPYQSISTRIAAAFQKDMQLLGVPLVLVITVLFFILTSLLFYLLLMLVDSTVYFYSCVVTLNLIILPIISIRLIKHQFNSTSNKALVKIHCQCRINLEVNEFVFLLRNQELRKQWQPYISEVQYKDLGQYKIVYHLDSTNTYEESFVQNVYREDSSVYVVEHSNFNILRVFHAIWQPSDEDEDRAFILKYYSKIPDILDNRISPNSQTAIRGLQQLIKSQRLNPKSQLFDYVQKSFQRQELPVTKLVQDLPDNTTQFKRPVEEPKVPQTQSISPQASIVQQVTTDETQEEQKQVIIPQVALSPEQLKFNKITEGQISIIKLDSKVVLEKEVQLTTENAWNLNSNSNGFQIHTRADPKTGNSFSRGEGIIPYPREEVFTIIEAVERRGEYDELFETGHLVKVIDQTQSYSIVYQKFKSMIVVSSRDFVIITRRFINADNSWTIIAASIDYPEVPEKKGTVRGNLIIGGWLLKATPDNGTHAIFSVLVDPKGSIPQKIVATSARIQGLCVEKIKKLLDKEKKKK